MNSGRSLHTGAGGIVTMKEAIDNYDEDAHKTAADNKQSFYPRRGLQQLRPA